MESGVEMQKYRCCFTGHRPEKLRRPEQEISAELEREIRRAIADGFTVFITGMARGIDIAAGEIVLQLRTEGFPIRLICASPFRGFESSWNWRWQCRYNAVMKAADFVLYICPKYHPGCFQIRNEWLVNHSSRVIAVFNGQSSGTKNTIAYAHQQGVPVILIEG